MSSIPDRLRSATPPEATDFGVRELMAVREIVHAFLTAERPEDVYQFALDRVSPLVGATFACVYVIDPGSDLMRLAAVHNWPQRYAQFLGQMRVRLGFGPSGAAASERRMIEVLDLTSDPSLEDWQEVATELGFRSFVALPLETSRAVLGTVTFYFASPNEVAGETRQLMRTVADQMAATAEKARLIEDLRRTNVALTESNAALERQYADVVEARRVKDEFLANISHELRTPLTAVVGYISLMQEGLAGPITTEQQRTLEQVKDASDQLLALIGDLLELTALKRGTIEARAAEIDPRDPLRDAIAGTKGRREQVSLDVSQPEIVPMMRSDRRTIAKVLKILLDNAFKFTRAGRVHCSVQIDRGRVTYAIEDTGVGIPSDAHRLVFEEFRQLDGTMTREFGGSGLGLALARRLARLVGGDITLVSAPGAGSTFKLELPLRHNDLERSE
ncbi:MAG: ATP-binding region ATPase domain protein [Gemmatimonadetes bacterium]|nr:ATP-binding region ATPase domain protein [Gemmatimonadota bacterium]